MPGLRLVLASANPDKAAEIAAILGDALGEAVELVPRPADVPDVVEDEDTLEGNARLKARALCEATGQAAVADDTGLEVDALGGEPGVRSARYAGEPSDAAANVAKLLAELEAAGAHDPADRRARFRTVVLACLPDGRELVASGEVAGWITTERRGAAGFGYDPVFVPAEGDGRTFAEMRAEEKHALSHRGRAVRALAEKLASWAPGPG